MPVLIHQQKSSFSAEVMSLLTLKEDDTDFVDHSSLSDNYKTETDDFYSQTCITLK